jgi:uncharacterized membrane protein
MKHLITSVALVALLAGALPAAAQTSATTAPTTSHHHKAKAKKHEKTASNGTAFRHGGSHSMPGTVTSTGTGHARAAPQQ